MTVFPKLPGPNKGFVILRQTLTKQNQLVRTIKGLPVSFVPGRDYAELRWNGSKDSEGNQPLDEANSPYRLRLKATFDGSHHACMDEVTAQVEVWKFFISIDDRPAGRETVVFGVDPETVNEETLEIRVSLDGNPEVKVPFTVTPRTTAEGGPPGNEWGCRVRLVHPFYVTPRTPYDIRYQVVIEQKITEIRTNDGEGLIIKTVMDGALNPWDMDPSKPDRQTTAIWRFGIDRLPGLPPRAVKREFEKRYLP